MEEGGRRGSEEGAERRWTSATPRVGATPAATCRPVRRAGVGVTPVGGGPTG